MVEACDYKELVDAPDGEDAPEGIRTRGRSRCAGEPRLARHADVWRMGLQPSPRLIW